MAFEQVLYNEYFRALLILAATILVGTAVQVILKNYITKITAKTKTRLDDLILQRITGPIHTFIILSGIFLALRYLTLLASYVPLMDKLYFVFAILMIATIFTKILGVMVPHWLKVQKRYEKAPRLINKIISIFVFLIAILMILSHFNIEISPLVAAFGLGGLAIGLALQETLSNFFAGLHIISDKPVRVGDFIEIENGQLKGTVEDIGWRSTRVRTLPNNIVIVPNGRLAESVIVNNSMPEHQCGVRVQCGVSYKSDLDKVEKVTIDVAKKIQKSVGGAVQDFEPFIRYHTFGDSNINFTIILRVEKFVDQYMVIHEFIKELKKAYDKNGIEISWPVMNVYQRK
jgi:small-conductance mechanosensitive channel